MSKLIDDLRFAWSGYSFDEMASRCAQIARCVNDECDEPCWMCGRGVKPPHPAVNLYALEVQA